MTAHIKPSVTFDPARLRADFPILAREVYGRPLVYLDNAASAQKPRPVLDAMDHAYRNIYANVHRGVHFLSSAATEAYEDARKTAQRFVEQVKRALDGTAPFVVTPMLDRARLVALLETFPDWVQQKSGLGDLTIRDVFDQQCALSPNRLVYIWSMDTHLQSYRHEP